MNQLQKEQIEKAEQIYSDIEIKRGKINFIGADSIENLIKYVKILFGKKDKRK